MWRLSYTKFFLFSLSKKRHYSPLFFCEERLHCEENWTKRDNCVKMSVGRTSAQQAKSRCRTKTNLKMLCCSKLRYTNLHMLSWEQCPLFVFEGGLHYLKETRSVLVWEYFGYILKNARRLFKKTDHLELNTTYLRSPSSCTCSSGGNSQSNTYVKNDYLNEKLLY